MKYFDSLRKLATAVCIGVAGIANAQTSHPAAFDTLSAGAYYNNFYRDYVGLRFQVASPLPIAGDKGFTTGNDGSGATGSWGGAPTNFINYPVKFGPVGDTAGCSPYPTGYFTGKIALVWRGNCEFGTKALAAQTAGASAVVIVNNVSGGPVGMAGGTSGASVTIPVYMISLDDGMAITSVLNSGGSVNLTIALNWNVGYNNDLGFVPAGLSVSANYAMPASQLAASSHPVPYKNINGAFVANFGLHDATNVKLHSDLSFTPTGGASSVVYSDSVALPTTFRAIDSIYTFFGAPYNVPSTGVTGRYDVTYNITSDSADQFAGNNMTTNSFYATDSVWSKGRYDFTKNQPISTYYTGPNNGNLPYIWGVPYYVAKGGSKMTSAQFSVSHGPGPLPGNLPMYVWVFKWHDTASTADSLMQVDELELVGAGIKSFDGTLDSSFQTFKVEIGDTVNGNPAWQVMLDANSWYYVAPEVPAGWALGCDGVLNAYPRTYGLWHFNNIHELYNPIYSNGDRGSDNNSMTYNGGLTMSPISFTGLDHFYDGVDSVVYSSQKHILPAVSFTSSTNVSGVNTTRKPFADINMYPNPATDNINISVKLDEVASQLVYSVIDAHGRFISREIHNNVQSEVYNYNTSSLAAGNYYIIVSSGNKLTSKKFTVLK